MNKKEEFEVKGKKYLTVQPCGMLYTQGREYFLLHPYPIDPDWENVFERRFVVVPNKQVGQLEEDGSRIFPVARHIVVTAPYLIDYNDMPLEILETSESEVALENTELPVRDVNDYIREWQELDNELVGLEEM
jgi:hypothetical protein